MCLYTGNKEGFIATVDIKCYKQLIKVGDNDWRTPSQNWSVKLGTTLIPDSPNPEIGESGYKWRIDGGVIHCYSGLDIKEDPGLFEATIPAGTRFWVQDDLKEFAAEKLVLSDKVAKNIDIDVKSLFYLGADVLLKDGSRKSVLDSYDKNDVIGIYAYDNQAISVDVNLSGIKFSKDPLTGLEESKKLCYDDARKDKDGEKNTEYLEKNFSKTQLDAIDWCRQRGGFLPSVDQLVRAFKNLISINLTRRYLGLEEIPFAWFWSSTMRDESSVWGVYSHGCYGSWHWYWYDVYWSDCCVVVFLGSHK